MTIARTTGALTPRTDNGSANYNQSDKSSWSERADGLLAAVAIALQVGASVVGELVVRQSLVDDSHVSGLFGFVQAPSQCFLDEVHLLVFHEVCIQHAWRHNYIPIIKKLKYDLHAVSLLHLATIIHFWPCTYRWLISSGCDTLFPDTFGCPIDWTMFISPRHVGLSDYRRGTIGRTMVVSDPAPYRRPGGGPRKRQETTMNDNDSDSYELNGRSDINLHAGEEQQSDERVVYGGVIDGGNFLLAETGSDTAWMEAGATVDLEVVR